MLYEKIRKIMLKGRSKSENKSAQLLEPSSEPRPGNKMLLTFMKPSELPPLQPVSSRKPSSNLSDILQHREKFINGYFQSIN
jgi:hypothetical protein